MEEEELDGRGTGGGQAGNNDIHLHMGELLRNRFD